MYIGAFAIAEVEELQLLFCTTGVLLPEGRAHLRMEKVSRRARWKQLADFPNFERLVLDSKIFKRHVVPAAQGSDTTAENVSAECFPLKVTTARTERKKKTQEKKHSL